MAAPQPTGHSISNALTLVTAKVDEAFRRRSADSVDGDVASRDQGTRLVAVSKIKPAESILTAYECGQRHFGENYVQELVEKANHPLLLHLEDIRWHFVGHLQRNKCNALTSVPHLWAVETVDSERLASALDASWKRRANSRRLKVFVQVNTSQELSKHGCSPAETAVIVQHIYKNCASLEFIGLMTIGQAGHVEPNPDFDCLTRTQKVVCHQLHLSPSEVELSMGMSSDYEQAIMAGSTSVRVGSAIFGGRALKLN